MVSGGHLYVGTAWQGLLRSASGLDGFVELQQNAAHGTRQLTEVRAMASTPNGRVIAYFGQNVYFSDNVGDAWTRYSNGLPRMANGEGPEFDHLATNGITIIGDARTRWLTPNRHVYIVPV